MLVFLDVLGPRDLKIVKIDPPSGTPPGLKILKNPNDTFSVIFKHRAICDMAEKMRTVHKMPSSSQQSSVL